MMFPKARFSGGAIQATQPDGVARSAPRADEYGLQLDGEGWVPVEELLAAVHHPGAA